MKYSIRDAVSADIPRMKEIMVRLAEFDLPPKREAHYFYEGDYEIITAWQNGKAPEVFIRVAETGSADTEDKMVIGVAIVTMREEMLDHKPSAHLEVACVSAEANGQGVGKQLIANAESEAQKRGATSMTLHVFGNNQRARHVYGQIGYDEELIRCIKHFG